MNPQETNGGVNDRVHVLQTLSEDVVCFTLFYFKERREGAVFLLSLSHISRVQRTSTSPFE